MRKSGIIYGMEKSKAEKIIDQAYLDALQLARNALVCGEVSVENHLLYGVPTEADIVIRFRNVVRSAKK